MAQDHLDPLPAPAAAASHLGVVATFEGPAPPFADLVTHLRSRLRLVPRYRQKLATSAVGPARWIDDPTFNLEYHVRHTAVPVGAGRDRRRQQLGRLFAQELDRTKPLWELWVIEGLEEGRWALVGKSHPALVERGVDLLTVLFDHEGGPTLADELGQGWVPRPAPSPAQLLALGLADTARQVTGAPARALRAAAEPEGLLRAARAAARRAAEAASRTLDPAPHSPLNVPPGPHRRLATAELPLADLRRVKDRAGGTVTDVVLAVTAGAVRTWMHERGTPTAGAELRAGVPVATRRDGLALVVAPLPIGQPDPLARLRRVTAGLAGLKERRGALSADLIAGAQDFAPPTILARALRLPADDRAYNVLVANVPGPQVDVHLLERRLRTVWPVAPLAGDRALAVAAMSYAGTVHVGLTGDLDALPDLDVLADGFGAALAELLTAADPPPGRPGGRRRPVRTRS